MRADHPRPGVRNQITAVIGVLVWMLAVEQIVINSYPLVGRWMPGQ